MNYIRLVSRNHNIYLAKEFSLSECTESELARRGSQQGSHCGYSNQQSN